MSFERFWKKDLAEPGRNGKDNFKMEEDFMCTAITYQTKNHYFGRTFDHNMSYGEAVVITPRKFPLRTLPNVNSHYAIIGMAAINDHYPLYFDATNEKGLSMAGLNFPENAVYAAPREGADNVPTFDFIPWILGQCETVDQAEELLLHTNLTDTPFSPQISPAPLHWLLADHKRSLTIESTKDGLQLYKNPIGVLTNNPPFPWQMENLSNYRALSPKETKTNFAPHVDFTAYSHGMGAVGLPGDYSSVSRFVRVAFAKLNAVSDSEELESISQFFHILGAVSQSRGCVQLDDDHYEITRYTSCCNTDLCIYYYTTYENSQITAVNLHSEDFTGTQLISYPLITQQRIYYQNQKETGEVPQESLQK